MTAVRARAWWVLVFFAVTLALFGAMDLASGVTADPAIPQALVGRTPAEVQAEDPTGYRLYDFVARSGGQLLIVVGTLLAAIIVIPYRGGQRWAWRLLWVLPIWAASVPLLYLAFGTAPNQPPAPPMISGPIFAVIAGAVLLVDRERFNAPQPSAS